MRDIRMESPIAFESKQSVDMGSVLLVNFTNLTEQEKEMVREWRNSSAIREWMFTDHVITREEHSSFVQGLKEDNKSYYWVVKNKANEYSGVIYLNRIDVKSRNAYLGIYVNPCEEKKGEGRVMMDALIRFAFNVLHFHTLKAEVIEGNVRALSLYKRSGLVEEGRLKEFVLKDNIWKDVIVMGIINEKG